MLLDKRADVRGSGTVSTGSFHPMMSQEKGVSDMTRPRIALPVDVSERSLGLRYAFGRARITGQTYSGVGLLNVFLKSPDTLFCGER